MSEIEENYNFIRENIRKICNSWSREQEDITLVAVSKRQSIDKIQELLDLGHRVFGENKVQEAYEHWDEIKLKYSDLKLHMIGHLQTNKAKDAVKLFDVIETIDSKKLALAISKEVKKQDKEISCYIQVNIGEEEQKYGAQLVELKELYDYCVDDCGLEIDGLMCIPPSDEPSGLYFALLNRISSDYDINVLSMGMSSDYDKAIMAGATSVRIGSAILGDRE